MIVEVQSPSTDLAHHVRKLERYRQLDSLLIYLVVNQRAPVVRVWRKETDRRRLQPTIVSAEATIIDLPEIGAAIKLADVYRTPLGVQP